MGGASLHPDLAVCVAVPPPQPLGAGLALGGGLSNLWERVRYGRVYDYVRFPKLPRLWRYVWNLADFAIVLGGTLLALLDRKK